MLRYNPERRVFESAPDLRVLSLTDMLGPGRVGGIEGSDVLVTSIVNDIGATAVRAMRQLERRFPDCYAAISGPVRGIEYVAGAMDRVRLIVEATIPPFDEMLSRDSWPDDYLRHALAAGCHGAIIDRPPGDIVQEFPQAVFFMRRNMP